MKNWYAFSIFEHDEKKGFFIKYFSYITNVNRLSIHICRSNTLTNFIRVQTVPGFFIIKKQNMNRDRHIIRLP